MSFRMVNTKHDTTSFENCGYKREIFDGNALYDGFLKAKQGSDWKPPIQKFEMTYLLGLSTIQDGLKNQTYDFKPTTDFVLRERGKVRFVSGEQFDDRIVKHCLCDEVLTPSLRPHLIYDNCASLQDRGIDLTRKRLLVHLRKYYQQHKSNEGYILLIDYSKYYDNIQHEVFYELVKKYVSDPTALWLLRKALDRAKVDVSYMDEEEFKECMHTVFNSLEHSMIDKSLLTGEKFMNKHLNIGDQVAQAAGIAYPIPIDNHVKIGCSVPFYARYTDDSYAIDESKEFLEALLRDITAIAETIGITVNLRKTRICKLSDSWRFLQVQYSLTETGRVIQKINPKRLTDMRRKMKKVANKRYLSPTEFEDWYKSWFKAHYKLMSKKQRENLDTLYNKLREELENVQNHPK